MGWLSYLELSYYKVENINHFHTNATHYKSISYSLKVQLAMNSEETQTPDSINVFLVYV